MTLVEHERRYLRSDAWRSWAECRCVRDLNPAENLFFLVVWRDVRFTLICRPPSSERSCCLQCLNDLWLRLMMTTTIMMI